MANVKMNPIFEGISKKVGDLVFFKRNGRTFLRRKGDRSANSTEAQLKVRAAFIEVAEIWHVLGKAVHSCWDIYAKSEHLTGYNAFLGANLAPQKKGLTLNIIHSAEVLQGFTAVSEKTGELTCSVSSAADGTGITLFTQKTENEAGNGPIVRHDLSGSSSVITGLETGAMYHVYALATEGAYDEASGIKAVAVQTVTVK